MILILFVTIGYLVLFFLLSSIFNYFKIVTLHKKVIFSTLISLFACPAIYTTSFFLTPLIEGNLSYYITSHMYEVGIPVEQLKGGRIAMVNADLLARTSIPLSGFLSDIDVYHYLSIVILSAFTGVVIGLLLYMAQIYNFQRLNFSNKVLAVVTYTLIMLPIFTIQLYLIGDLNTYLK